ncbi:Hypothetical predicted protein [Mytilus galloprovincialis]|uniref:Uncharacterized protein n=1 Tax=Mytilus galloprovincialis TaxID=29158 RepID=A0A8B6D1N1_MYTGA|nr:Hypothetical predicted protein [Mytilus galloprovincialis]
MDFLQLNIWLISLILLSEGFMFKRRFKRYPTPPPPTTSVVQLTAQTYRAIVNDSVPITCPQNKIIRKRMSHSADSLQSMLIENGGAIIPQLIATEDDSSRKFKNLLNFGTFVDEEGIDNHFESVKSPLYKDKLEDDLRKWNHVINSIKSANNSKSANTTLLESISDIVHNNINTTIPAMEIHTTESSNSAIHHTISDFLVQNDITLQQLLDYVKSMKISTNPKILMSLQQHKFKRKKRNAGGSTSIQQYCVKKGAPVKNSLLSLCGECAVTTLLPQDRYPRKLNEAVCDNTDLTCLSFSGRPQGACIPGIINLTFLRRRPGSCRMMIRTGDVVDVDEWEPYTQRVRTGCHCAIDKRSYIIPRIDGFAPIVG